jgi:predicted PurR-regulated permease PerM
MNKERMTIAFLAGLALVAVYFCYLLVAPFLKPIAFSVILAIVFYPAHAFVHCRIRKRNFSALLSTSLVILLLSLVALFLGRAIVSGLADIYQSLTSPSNDTERLGLYIVQVLGRATDWINEYFPISVPHLRTAVSNQAEKLVSSLLGFSAGAVGGFTAFLVNAVISFFILFFLFRDGRSMLHRVAVVIPLRRDQVARLFACVRDTLNAILYGTVAIAVVQGVLAGIAFAVLGISSPVLWGIVTALCALLPVIGTAFVFVPATGMLFVNGHWIKAVILLVWALAIVHPVDNVLRPFLIGGRAKLSTLYVFFALLGGLKAFGSLGLFIGPLILALTVALFRFLREDRRSSGLNLFKHANHDIGVRTRSSDLRGSVGVAQVELPRLTIGGDIDHSGDASSSSK